MPQTFVTFPPKYVTRVEQIVPPAHKVFKYLPIRIAELNETARKLLAEIPGVYVHESAIASYIPILRSIDALGDAQYPMVANISLAPEPRPADLREPIHVATRIMAAGGHVVVFAAGNAGPQVDTLSPWSVAPWTICVGATDELGSKLWPNSSVGVPGRTGPDVVAIGKTVVPLHEFRDDDHGTMVGLVLAGKEGGGRIRPGLKDKAFEGTSVSAPRVTRICHILLAVLRAALCTRILLLNCTAGDLSSATFQTISARLFRDAKIETPEIPFLDKLESIAIKPLLDMAYQLELRGVPLEPESFERSAESPFPVSVVKKLLGRMAQPMPEYARHEVGSGFVSEKSALDYLGKLTLDEFASLALRRSLQSCLRDCVGADQPIFHSRLLQHIVDQLATSVGLTSYKVL